ncbi:MAG: fatty acid desaturase [Pseudomonadota bacterium]
MVLALNRETTQSPSLNLAIIAIVVLVNAIFYFILPIYLLPLHNAWILVLVPVVLSTITHWALIHEAIHTKLVVGRARNDAIGRLLSTLFGAPFEIVRFGHLSHHSLNAKATERPEIIDPGRDAVWRFRAAYYFRLCFGVYTAEILSTLLAWLPRRYLEPVVRRIFYEGEAEAQSMADRAVKVILNVDTLRAIRTDSVVIIALIITACWLYGPWWPAFLIALAGRAFIVSFMDNAPHYAGELGDPNQGYDMHLPKPWQALVLNSNFHGTHHRHPNLPWTALPIAFEADQAHYAGGYLTLPLRQFMGPVTIDQILAANGNKGQMPLPGDPRANEAAS